MKRTEEKSTFDRMARIVSVALALFAGTMVRGQDPLGRYAEAMTVSKDDVNECLDKAGMTLEGLIRMHETREEELAKDEMREITGKTGCFMACMYQKQKTMEGSKIQIDKMHEVVNKRYVENPAMSAALHESIDGCAKEVNDSDKDCEAAMTFTTCMSKSLRAAKI